MTNPELKSCGVLIVHGDPLTSFLLMKHANRWDLPKGHVDPGETEIECALRELEEETGIPAGAVTLEPHFRYTQQYVVTTERSGGKPCMKSLVIFLGRVDPVPEIQVTEHQGFAWFPWSPPHQIQAQTIDPLLTAVEEFIRVSTKRTIG